MGLMGVSAPSLHIESTDSMIDRSQSYNVNVICSIAKGCTLMLCWGFLVIVKPCDMLPEHERVVAPANTCEVCLGSCGMSTWIEIFSLLQPPGDLQKIRERRAPKPRTLRPQLMVQYVKYSCVLY